MNFITTLCGVRVKVDKDIYKRYGSYRWRIPYKGLVSSSQIIEGKRERSLRSLVLDLSEMNRYKTVYFKDGDRYNLTRENLSLTNVTIEDKGGYCEGHLTGGDIFLFNAQYKDLVKSRTWYINAIGYLSYSSSGTHKLFHRLIMNPAEGKVVDHINHNKLDNRLCNLRSVTVSDNVFNRKGAQSNNSSGCRGVHRSKEGTWSVRFTKEGKTTRLGTFRDLGKAKEVAENYLMERGR